jgi:hypothetical protein
MAALRRIFSAQGSSAIRALIRQSIGFAVGVGLLSLSGEQQAAFAAIVEALVYLVQVGLNAPIELGRTEEGVE